jgi:predicted ABC-type ATPase
MAKRRAKPRILIIAGPNGAGKTTFAREFLTREAGCPDFINADLIAQGLSPFKPEEAAIAAGRIMLQMMREKVRKRESFAFETTLSGRNYAAHIPRWRRAGYHVTLIFLSLPSVAIALSRIRARVAQGGHNIAAAVVRRRFKAGLENFHRIYSKLVDAWILYDNRGRPPIIMDEGENR